MTTHFADLSQRAAAARQLSAEDVLALRREGWGDGVITREEAEALFAINNALDQRGEEWLDPLMAQDDETDDLERRLIARIIEEGELRAKRLA